MNIIKVINTQPIHIEESTLFNTEDARNKYVQMNGDLCFYNRSSLTTDKSVVASTWYNLLYNGIFLSFHLRSTVLLKLTHDLKSNLVQNRFMGYLNNEHVISIHNKSKDETDLPFILDHCYYHNSGETTNEQCFEIMDLISEDFKKRLKIAVNYSFVNLNFYAFKKCQDIIIGKITEKLVETAWDNFLDCSADHSASHYINSYLYPERECYF